ncbi:hypothetical protein Scep_020133 [Stephania cephalantha]|uniref:Uncharacterized protein n=1 Tax=Stephania cephalantha TaxID=152367 RepID=A0AAP0NNP1_9MAGN
MAYASRLLHEQPIASSSFVEVTTPYPLLLCLIGDQSVRQCATASLLHAVPAPLPPHHSESHRRASRAAAGVVPPCQRPSPWNRRPRPPYRFAAIAASAAIRSAAALLLSATHWIASSLSIRTAAADPTELLSLESRCSTVRAIRRPRLLSSAARLARMLPGHAPRRLDRTANRRFVMLELYRFFSSPSSVEQQQTGEGEDQ